jgi:UDP-N-acetylglucosamine acyltransferase
MTGAHVAHDAHVGDRVIVANQGAIAGHCVIEDDVIIGGLSGIHQWVRVGKGAIIGAVSMVTNDVIPYGLVQAPRGELHGLNLVGLKRKGVSRADITALRAAFQMLAQGDGAFADRARKLGEENDSPYVQEIVDFILGSSDRHFLTPER